MIYLRRYISIEGVLSLDLNKFYMLGGNSVEQCAEEIEAGLNEHTPLAYLKDPIKGTLLELKLVDDQVIKSYVLDLFDFDKEIKELI